MAHWDRPGLTAEQKREMWSRWKAGQSLSEIGRALGKERSSIHRMVASAGDTCRRRVVARPGCCRPPSGRRSRAAWPRASRCARSPPAPGGLLRRSAGRSPATVAAIGTERSRRTSGPGSVPTARSRASSPRHRSCGSSWRPSSHSTGHRNRSRAGLPGPTRRSRLCRCRPRRSTRASSCRPAGCCARSSWPISAPAAPSAARASPAPKVRAGAGSSTRSPSGSARPRPRTGRCPATGRATSWQVPPTATSPPSSSARPATCSS